MREKSEEGSPGAVVRPLGRSGAVAHHVGALAVAKQLPDLPSRPRLVVRGLGRVTILGRLKKQGQTACSMRS